ncbi:hypothetical protein [Desulfomicrobium baculatum]|uniref:Uncharacterized protein n=1 Tax=Desulfomicrobium baculatum (strain DSM 4028 / VKM B-1378 / X) TaxID=525897 RepID=C7LQW0_DESBD|nr:hypothetical protein [Desulfomicrobium baculatum]ACU89189.1 hypothetical protein Dbac_1081 [Desulfomicrobium baculatum DSM 4028]
MKKVTAILAATMACLAQTAFAGRIYLYETGLLDVERGSLAGRLQGNYGPSAIHLINLAIAYRL